MNSKVTQAQTNCKRVSTRNLNTPLPKAHMWSWHFSGVGRGVFACGRTSGKVTLATKRGYAGDELVVACYHNKVSWCDVIYVARNTREEQLLQIFSLAALTATTRRRLCSQLLSVSTSCEKSMFKAPLISHRRSGRAAPPAACVCASPDRRSPPSHVRHVAGHDRHVQHVRPRRQRGHREHRLRRVLGREGGLRPHRPVRLRHALPHGVA